jgi:tRNA pseudouridine38-40 synthase
MRNLKLTLAYVGTRFAGWQVQPGRETIQGILEDRLSGMLGEKVRLAGAGRTDAGVHARGQVANFLTAAPIPGIGLRRGLNARLPEEINVVAVEEASETFHARADARWKEYRYRLRSGEGGTPFEAPFTVVVHGPLDAEAMRDAAARLCGRRDFTSFCPAQSEIEDKVRTIMMSEVLEEGPVLEYRVRADGFLRHMVRTLVGTLIAVGRGLVEPASIESILAARDRRAAGPVAPARGLVLERVSYDVPPATGDAGGAG